MKVIRLGRGVNSLLLEDPAGRYPSHRVIDLAKWLEGQ